MRHFKYLSDMNQLPETDPAYTIIKGLIESCNSFEGYTPESDGWICWVEEQDVEGPLTDLWDDTTLLDIPWEGIMKIDGFYQGIYLANNQFGIVFVIPDAPWVNGKLRKVIEENLDP